MNKEYIHKDTRTDEPLHNQIETLTRWQDPTIYEKDKEIERLNNEIKTLLKENDNKEKVIIKQNNIINELEKWLESEIDRIIKLKSPKRRSIPPYGEENYYYENMILRYKEVLDKLKELKEGKQ